MHYFYSKNINDTTIELSKEEAHHASRVLRLNVGDEVGVFNGEGSIFNCHISALSKNACSLSIVNEIKSSNSRSGLTILIAPTKSSDRFEWFLEKATEIGVGVIVPILTDHSERRKIRIDRLEKVIISAMKQSMNPFLPELRPLQTFSDVVDEFLDSDRFISHCEDSKKGDLNELINGEVKTVIMIGPEGDFSPTEIKKANDMGWKEVSLGDQRFRTETAGIVAVLMYSLKN